MEFNYKCYLLKHGFMEEMVITRKMLTGLGIASTEEEINSFLEKNKHHYLLLEFYCNQLGLSHKGEEEFLSPTSYSEYLNGVLCENGFITFIVINHELGAHIDFSRKAKRRYDRSNQTILIHVPYDLDTIYEEDVAYLNSIEDNLYQLDSVYIYSQKKKWNGKYKTGKEYTLQEFYTRLNKIDKKIR